MQVLVVDDDDLARRFTRKVLESRGYEVLDACGGREALELASDPKQIDLLILDIVMPEMDGFETLEGLRSCGVRAPVVMLTGKSEDDSILKGYQAGADYYITKPYTPDSLLNIVDFLVGDLSEDERARLEMLI